MSKRSGMPIKIIKLFHTLSFNGKIIYTLMLECSLSMQPFSDYLLSMIEKLRFENMNPEGFKISTFVDVT